MRYLKWRGAVLALMAALLMGCTAPTAAPVSSTPGTAAPNVEQGYPGVPSPESTLASYPGQVTPTVPPLQPGEAPFRLDRPLLAGATQVTGSGTPGVPIILYNVTFMGEVMSETTLDESGRFAFTVPPLEANVSVGIGLGDLSGTRWTSDYFLAPGFRGDEAVALPNVGYFLDTVLVTAP